MNEIKAKMARTIDLLKDSLIGIRSTTVSPGFVETLKVPYYGSLTYVKHIANVSRCEAGITIMPHDSSLVNGIAKFLQDKNLLNAFAFSKTTVVVSIPPCNSGETERIKAHVRKLGEDAKVSIRNIRKNFRQTLTKDEIKKVDKQLQILVDDFCNKIDLITGIL